MSSRFMLTGAAILLIGLAVFGACGGGAGGDLTIYSGREESLVGPIIEQFREATGIDVGVKYGSNPGLVATIQEEGDNSPADIFFGSEPGALGALEDRLTPLPEALLNRVASSFRSRQGKWVGISGRSRVVVYNTDRLTEADLPASILGFTDPQWKGRIGWAPTNGSFQAFVTALRKLEGEEVARQWLEGIRANNPKTYPKNTPIVKAVSEGEIDVGFVNHYYLFRFIAEEGEDFPARNYYPIGGDPGATVLVAGAGILDSAKNRENAERFLEFMLSTEAQQYFTRETFEYPLVEGVEHHALLVPLSQVQVPDIDLSQLSDLEATLKLLRDTGVLP
ncbi:MAG: iron ABC transporter substrate-binding protein [Dehalococcoidia bacterium]